MAKLLKLRRGTTSQHSSFTGAEGEVTVDTTKDTVVVHDGSTAGGIPLAKESDALSLIDEDNMATNSATRPPSQQSVKAYTDTTFAPKAAPAFTGTATGVNLTLSGNLTVNGTTTTVATTNTTVKDNLLELNSGATSNANDSGILIERGSTGDNAIIAWDESADKFVVGTTTAANDATGDLTIATGTLVGNVEGNVTGTVTGTATGLAGSPNITVGTIGCGAITGTSTVADSKGDVRKVFLNDQADTNAYTAVAADAGKAILTRGQVNVPGNIVASGDMITIVNDMNSDITIAPTVGLTLYNTADASTGNRTLATRGMATIWFQSAGIGYISGTGLS